MEYVYATLLLHSAGKEITEESLRKVLESAGLAVDDVKLKSFVAALKEVNIDEVIKTATAMPVAPVVAAPAAPAQSQQAAAAPAEKKEEEEKKETVTEEQLAEGLASLFG